MSTNVDSSTKDDNSQRTVDFSGIWNHIRTKVNTIPSQSDTQPDQIYGQGDNAGKINSTPTMVFSVIGDSDSFVPRPWPKTVFQTALIEAAKSGGETWILFRMNNAVVSNVVQEAYQHYEDMEFKTENVDIGDPQRHIKLINIAEKGVSSPSKETSENHENEKTSICKIPEVNIGEDEDQLLDFEKYISEQEVSFFNPKMKIKMPIPVAIIVCEGDLKTIVHIAKALQENIPVIIMKGSGKAADLVLDYIEKDGEFRKKASISFGIQFDHAKYEILTKYLGQIAQHKDLVGVFDLDQDDPRKLSNIVGETVVSCWSMEHVIATKHSTTNNNEESSKTTEDTSGPSRSRSPEHGRTFKDNNKESSKTTEDTSRPSSSRFPKHGRTLKGFSLFWKILQKHSVSPEYKFQNLEELKRKSRPYVLNPKFSTPTSLPLYFYFVYQLLQESNLLKDCGPILLLEALKANRCDYVRVLLAKGVTFKKADLPELYGQTVACKDCKDECLHIEWILKQLKLEEAERMCHTYKESKNGGERKDKNPAEDIVADAAEALCCIILGYGKCDCGTGKTEMLSANKRNGQTEMLSENKRNGQTEMLSENKRNGQTEMLSENKKKDESTISDILLWAIFANRKELAEICWLRSENHLLTGLVCSTLLKKLSKKANNVKEQILSIEFEEHSKMFEQHSIALMNSMYKEDTQHAIDLMEDEAHVWGIHSSPLTFAYENYMYDVVAHTCSQKNMNKKWYNTLPPDFKPFVKSVVNKPGEFFFAPLTKYIINYIMFLIMLVMYSAFVLTSVGTEYYIKDIARVFEYFVYFWGAGDFIEELISCSEFLESKGRSYRTTWHRVKRYVIDFWNAVDLLSHVLLIAALCVRHFRPSHRFTSSRRMFSLSLLVMYLRFLQCFLIHRKMGPTLIMIKEMLKDLSSFITISMFVVLGVGIYYHANLWPDHQTMWSGDWTNWRIWTILHYPYWQLYGEINLDYLDGSKPEYDEGECTNITSVWESDSSQERCPQEDWTVQAVAAFYMLFSNLLLVNLVIAMFSYTFERVQENSEKLWRFERYTVINDYDWRIPSPFNLPWRVYSCLRRLKCICCCCKNCPCSGTDEKLSETDKIKHGKNLKFRRNFQKIIALRNHNKI